MTFNPFLALYGKTESMFQKHMDKQKTESQGVGALKVRAFEHALKMERDQTLNSFAEDRADRALARNILFAREQVALGKDFGKAAVQGGFKARAGSYEASPLSSPRAGEAENPSPGGKNPHRGAARNLTRRPRRAR